VPAEGDIQIQQGRNIKSVKLVEISGLLNYKEYFGNLI
jgi:hypothetical protein